MFVAPSYKGKWCRCHNWQGSRRRIVFLIWKYAVAKAKDCTARNLSRATVQSVENVSETSINELEDPVKLSNDYWLITASS